MLNFEENTFVMMSIYRFLTVGCLALLCSACAFNSRFHRAERIPLAFEQVGFFNHGTDTTYVDYDEHTQEVRLSNSQKESLHQGYTIKNTYVTSTTGNVLHAWILRPTHTQPLATILHFHGSGGNILTQYQAIAPLANLGYQVFMFDYSGYGVSTGKASRKNALQDAYSALAYVADLSDTNNTQLILYGQSYGGYLAGIVGSSQQAKIDGIVIEGAFSAHKDEAKFTTPFFGNLVKNGKVVAEEITANHKPVLIIHSREDQVVPIEFGKKIYEHANEPKAFYEIDKPHILGLQYKAQEISDKITTLMLHD